MCKDQEYLFGGGLLRPRIDGVKPSTDLEHARYIKKALDKLDCLKAELWLSRYLAIHFNKKEDEKR